LRDKQGRSCSCDEVEENWMSDKDVNSDHYLDGYLEEPEWTPDFCPPNNANDQVAEDVNMPKDQPVKMVGVVDSKTSQLSASCESIDNSISQQEKSISFTFR
jgi:hypothetical protein